MNQTQAIVCALTKWDIIPRKDDVPTLTQLLYVTIIDESHLLYDLERDRWIEICAHSVMPVSCSIKRQKYYSTSQFLDAR